MKALELPKALGALSDEEIINRILAGERELYEILLRRNNQTLYRAVRSYLKDENDVEDTMQETYIKAYKNLGQFRREASFSTWLVRIGINEALSQLRKQKKRRIIALFGNDENENSKIEQIPDTKLMNPEKQVMDQESRQLLEKAIDQLPSKYKIIYMLRELEDMSNQEIASCLNLSDSNVKVRFHRAKDLLKNHILSLSEGRSVFEFGNEHCDRLVERVMSRI